MKGKIVAAVTAPLWAPLALGCWLLGTMAITSNEPDGAHPSNKE